MQRLDAGLAAIALVSLSAIGAALVSQHVFDMQPCPWCVLQRLIYVAIAVAALLGLLWRAQAGRLVALGLVVALSLAGLAAALWQHFVAAQSASCLLTFPDRLLAALGLDAQLPEVFQPRASCADAAVALLGVPYEFWSLALYVLLAAAALVLALPRRGP